MITGKLKSGFEYSIEESRVDDWGMLKLLRGIDKGNEALIVDVVERLLGEEQADALAEHLAVNGVTSISAMTQAVDEIFTNQKPVKN